MFGCDAVVITLLIVAELILPVTVKLFRLPKLVILFKADAPKIPLNVPPSIIPDTDKLLN